MKKRIVYLVLALLISLTLYSCGNNTPAETTTNNPTEEGTYLTRLPKGNEYDIVSMEILKNNKDEIDRILQGLEENA